MALFSKYWIKLIMDYPQNKFWCELKLLIFFVKNKYQHVVTTMTCHTIPINFFFHWLIKAYFYLHSVKVNKSKLFFPFEENYINFLLRSLLSTYQQYALVKRRKSGDLTCHPLSATFSQSQKYSTAILGREEKRRESWRKGAPQGRGRAEVSGLEIKGNH